ncbi:MAG: FG-GAP-like repeat-containing protein [Bacteroidota bacterium]
MKSLRTPLLIFGMLGFLVLLGLGITGRLPISSSEQANIEAFQRQCQSCHLLPDPKSLSKSVWRQSVLPEMAARTGFSIDDYNPYKFSYQENYHIKKANVYPPQPTVNLDEWEKVYHYILRIAPDTIEIPSRSGRNKELAQFRPNYVSGSAAEEAAGVTCISFQEKAFPLIGTFKGSILESDSSSSSRSFRSPVSSIAKGKDGRWLTEFGIMNPSENACGTLYLQEKGETSLILNDLHRPVYIHPEDLNDNGKEELLICEFGFHTGQLSLLTQTDTGYHKKSLLSLPGSIKVEVKDMNQDGKKDIVALFSQAWEGVRIFYQEEELKFRMEEVLKFGPGHGSSWFELVDFNQDGHQDIVMVNGDNGDYSIRLKEFHGIRLFLNKGNNQFEEAWFYPIHGSTRVISKDFDQDGDLDFAVMSFFPDWKNSPEEGFVYLENQGTEDFSFTSYTHSLLAKHNWMVMEAGDIDEDGDEDIVLGAFDILKQKGKANPGESILILQNTLSQ